MASKTNGTQFALDTLAKLTEQLDRQKQELTKLRKRVNDLREESDAHLEASYYWRNRYTELADGQRNPAVSSYDSVIAQSFDPFAANAL